MRIRHLGLPVTDADRSIAFYAAHLGFDATTAQRFDDGTVIVRSDFKCTDPDGHRIEVYRDR